MNYLDIMILIYLIGFVTAFILQVVLIYKFKACEIYNTNKIGLQMIGFCIILVFWLLFVIKYIVEESKNRKIK